MTSAKQKADEKTIHLLKFNEITSNVLTTAMLCGGDGYDRFDNKTWQYGRPTKHTKHLWCVHEQSFVKYINIRKAENNNSVHYSQTDCSAENKHIICMTVYSM